jgi:hypothetical protein
MVADKKPSMIPAFDTFRVKYKDIFDVKEFYDALHEWLMEHDWRDEEDDGEHWETYYDERVLQNEMKEMRIFWRLVKFPPPSSYLQFYLDIDFKCLGMGKTEIIRDGQKIKTGKGEMELTIRGYIDKKYESKFDSDNLLKYFTKIFTNRIYRKNLEEKKKVFYNEAYEMQNFIKNWLKLKRYLPYEETRTFFPSAAFPSHLKEEK